MKGILIATALLVVVGLFAGCGSEPSDLGEATPEQGTRVAPDTAGEAHEAGEHPPGGSEEPAHEGKGHEVAEHDGPGHTHGGEQAGILPAGANQMCPVIPDEKVDPSIFVEYEGKRIYVCCEKCRKRVLEDPAAWFAKAYGAGQQD